MSDDKTILVVHKRPGLAPEVVEIARTLDAIKALVDGAWLELFGAAGGAHGYCDEGGKRKQLPPNFGWNGDVICGPVVFSKADSQGREVGFDDPVDALAFCEALRQLCGH